MTAQAQTFWGTKPVRTLEDSSISLVSRYALPFACLGWVAVIWLWSPAVIALTVDDSFYYFKIALNIAAGHGVTFDQVQPTNGFHPLWLAVLVGIAAVFRDASTLLVKVVLSAQVVLVYLGTLLLGRIERVDRNAIRLVVAILLANFYCAKVFVNGQESALQYVLLCCCLWYGRQKDLDPNRTRWQPAALLGFLAGLTALARLEAALFATILLSMPLFWPCEYEEEAGLRVRVRDFVAGSGTFAAVVAPYAVWNLVSHGHLVPVSAAVKYGSLSEHLPLAGLFTFFVASIAVMWILHSLERSRRRNPSGMEMGAQRCIRWLRLLFPLGWYVLFLLALEALRGRLLPQVWCLPPHLTLATIVAAIAATEVQRSRWLFRPILATMLALVVVFAAVTWTYRLDPRSYEAYVQATRSGEWLEKNTSPDALVAGWDCGITAYFSQRRFLNLDGFVSSWDYKREHLDRGLVGRFVNEVHRVEYIAQHFYPESLKLSTRRSGIDLSSWYVAFAQEGHVRLAYNPRQTRVMISLVLSRQPVNGGVTVSEFAAHVTSRQQKSGRSSLDSARLSQGTGFLQWRLARATSCQGPALHLVRQNSTKRCTTGEALASSQ